MDKPIEPELPAYTPSMEGWRRRMRGAVSAWKRMEQATTEERERPVTWGYEVITDYEAACRHLERALGERPGNEAVILRLGEVPAHNARRPFYDEVLQGAYEESDRDYCANNNDLAVALLDAYQEATVG